MAKNKFIYWRPDIKLNSEGEMFANVHLLVGYNTACIADFLRMADELRETFPQAGNDKIQGGKVSTSATLEGHTIITWNEYIPKGEYPGWHQMDNGRIEYGW